MNALMYVIGRIKSQIPHELLYYGMTYGEDSNLVNMSSLDEKLMARVIRPVVLLDANVVGGLEHIIPLGSVRPNFAEPMYTVYSIPPELIMGKEILSAQAITYLPNTGFSGIPTGFGGSMMVYSQNQSNNYNNRGMMNIANRIGAAASGNGVVNNANVELVSRNTVAVFANFQTLANYALRVVLENDSNLNNIQPKSYHALSELAVLATKMVIYNKLIIPVNSGYLSGGQELGVFKSILESYAEAYEQYSIYLKSQWKPIAYMNDTRWHHEFITGMIAPDL